jgi:Flp pilus assembly protein TadD
MRKFPQALAETDLALALDPNNAYALDARGRAYEATGRREEALRAYRAALSLKPDLPDSVQGLKRLQELP